MNVKEIKQFIGACDLTDSSPLIEGKHGIGKSDILRQYAEENNMHCETLILSLMDVSDLMGMPRSAEIGGAYTTIWNSPDWFNRIVNAAFPPEVNFEDIIFKDENLKDYMVSNLNVNTPVNRADINRLYCVYFGLTDDTLHITTSDVLSYSKAKRSVLFIDEFNRAPVDILNASLQLILDKRLHSHILPKVNGKPTLVVAAVNPADTDYTVNAFDPALLDRFVFGAIEADAKAWLDWARDTDQAPIVRDFLSEHPNRIHFTAKDGKSSATPRSWTRLSSIIKKIDQIPKAVQFELMKGCIGEELASQFLSYFNHYSKVVKMEDVEKLIESKAKTIKNIEVIAKHVAKLIDNQEAIQKSELAENFYKKYIKETDPEKAKPLLAYLYALELEILNSFLKSKREDSFEDYMNLAKLDQAINNKALFKKVTTKIK